MRHRLRRFAQASSCHAARSGSRGAGTLCIPSGVPTEAWGQIVAGGQSQCGYEADFYVGVPKGSKTAPVL